MSDAINPQHYKLGDVQPVDIAEHLSFNAGNIIKYVSRAGRKGDAVEDLLKARWYLNREIARITKDKKPEKDDGRMEMALRAEYLSLNAARAGTMKRTPDGTEWVKSGKDTWGNVSNKQRGSFTDDFGLAKRIVCD